MRSALASDCSVTTCRDRAKSENYKAGWAPINRERARLLPCWKPIHFNSCSPLPAERTRRGKRRKGTSVHACGWCCARRMGGSASYLFELSREAEKLAVDGGASGGKAENSTSLGLQQLQQLLSLSFVEEAVRRTNSCSALQHRLTLVADRAIRNTRPCVPLVQNKIMDVIRAGGTKLQ